jgi:uridine phosphorylase
VEDEEEAAHDPPTIALKPQAPLAERVLLPGDPQRALAIAQAELEQPPAMFNHRRGLWGYTGIAQDGKPLTVQSTGMGGPSAAMVVEELIRLGARTLVRVGTCGALVPEVSLGELIVATEAIGADGTSAALGAPPRQRTDARLTEALLAACLPACARMGGGNQISAGGARSGPVVTTDVFYDERPGIEAEWTGAGAIAVEMEAATVLAAAARHGVAGACLLAVTDQLASGHTGRQRMSDDEVEAVGLELGRVAVDALCAAGDSPA